MVFNGEKKIKQIVFRVDSSTQIGSGHLMRCLTLARELKNKVQIVFVSRDLEGNVNCLIKRYKYQLIELPRINCKDDLHCYEKWLTVKQEFDAKQTIEKIAGMNVTYLVVDNYAIDEIWENKLRPYVKKIMVIDDLANRKHNCDILLDQTFNAEKQNKYNDLVPVNCQLYLGLSYVLLRREFYEQFKQLRKREEKIKNILVFFGGSDDTEETLKVLKALQCFYTENIKIVVITGNSNIKKDEVKKLCNSLENVEFYCQVNNMAEFIHQADLAFGAAGCNTWERCFLGVPTVVTVTAENQFEIAREVSEYGAIYNLGWHENIDYHDYLKVLQTMDRLPLKDMSEKSLSLVGKNNLDEVVQELVRG